MIYFANILIIFLLTTFTVSMWPALTATNTVPLLPLFFVIGLTYFRRGVEPLLLAAIAGIILDLYSAYPFGMYLGIFLAIAGLIRIFFYEGLKEMKLSTFTFLCMLGILTMNLAQALMLAIDKVTIEAGTFALLAARSILLNLVFVIPLYLAINYYFDKIKKYENYRKRR